MERKPFPVDRYTALVVDPIYTEYNLSGVKDDKITAFMGNSGTVDAYCIDCECHSVFEIIDLSPYNSPYNPSSKAAESLLDEKLFTIRARCTRDNPGKHGPGKRCKGFLLAIFLRREGTLIKIGQHPPKASMDFGSLDPIFNKELPPNLRGALGRAVGLRAYGIGVGSFVYLRRIWESLIEEAHVKASKEAGWNEQQFHRSRMPEKITMLSAYLPSRLVKTAHLYGLLSKGLHELSEAECLAHFDLVKKAIEWILRERYEEQQHQEIIQNLDKVRLGQ